MNKALSADNIKHHAMVMANNQAIYLDKLASYGIITEGALYGSWDDGEDEIQAIENTLEWGMHYVAGPLWRKW